MHRGRSAPLAYPPGSGGKTGQGPQMPSLVARPGSAERRGSLLSYLVPPSSLPSTRFHQFALDRLHIDLGIAQGRLQIFVSQEFTHRWQADPAAELDGRVGVAQPVDRDGFLLSGKMLGACGACLLHVALEVIPDGAVIESLAISSAFTHITTEEGINSAHRFEQFPQQRDTVTGVDQGDHPFLVPLAHNPQVATIKVVEMHVHLNNLDGGYLRIVGKGNKERVIPL